MTICRIATCVGLTALAGTLLVSSEQPVHALTMKECSAKYQAAKTAGTRSAPRHGVISAKPSAVQMRAPLLRRRPRQPAAAAAKIRPRPEISPDRSLPSTRTSHQSALLTIVR